MRHTTLKRLTRVIVSAAALLLVWMTPSAAQITASLDERPDGTTEIRIRNDGATDLEAFAFSAKYSNQGYIDYGPLVVWVDPALRSFPNLNRFEDERTPAEPLAPGEQFVWPFGFLLNGATRPVQLEGLVVAGLFADGSTTGNPALLTRLLDRRNNMLLAVEVTLETLLDADNEATPLGQVVRQFETLAESTRRSYLPPEQQVGLGLYRSIVGKLLDLPDGEGESLVLPRDFVARESERLNRQRVELAALVASQPGPTDWAQLSN